LTASLGEVLVDEEGDGAEDSARLGLGLDVQEEEDDAAVRFLLLGVVGELGFVGGD
jgi:hypothetical protein